MRAHGREGTVDDGVDLAARQPERPVDQPVADLADASLDADVDRVELVDDGPDDREDGAAEHRQARDERRRRGERRRPAAPPEEARRRLEHRREQQRGEDRQDDEPQPCEHEGDDDDGSGDDEQPPRDRRERAQPGRNRIRVGGREAARGRSRCWLRIAAPLPRRVRADPSGRPAASPSSSRRSASRSRRRRSAGQAGSSTVWPGLCPASTSDSVSTSGVGLPPIEMITSPCRMPAFVGRAAGLDGGDEDSVAADRVADADAEVRAVRVDDLAVGDDLAGDVLYRVARDREADPGGLAAELLVRRRERRDADQRGRGCRRARRRSCRG